MSENNLSNPNRPIQIGPDLPITGRFFEGVSNKTGRPYTFLAFYLEGFEIGREFPDAFKRSWIENTLGLKP